MDWDDLRFYLAVIRHKSLAGAARELHVTQSTVGRRLASLEAVVADYGLAKRLGADPPEGADGKTVTGQIKGTPAYLAPEVVEGGARAAGPPADVFALGVILYQVLAGRLPTTARSPVVRFAPPKPVPHTLQRCSKLAGLGGALSTDA